jgi:penicillin-binding protein 2
MRDAIAFSSNVYFYTIGGGFEGQPGLGITRLNHYFDLFGIGDRTGISLLGEVEGTVPNPEWKEEIFDDDWRLGDTYFTAIGQYGFLATPLQILRGYAAIANGGYLVTPHVVLHEEPERVDLDLDRDDLEVIHEGMRRTVIQAGGTARALERKDVEIAAKSGTAELDASNSYVNSWVAGFFPYEEPKYAFVLFMERGPYENTLGAGRVMGWVFDWLSLNRPEYFTGD